MLAFAIHFITFRDIWLTLTQEIVAYLSCAQGGLVELAAKFALPECRWHLLAFLLTKGLYRTIAIFDLQQVPCGITAEKSKYNVRNLLMHEKVDTNFYS